MAVPDPDRYQLAGLDDRERGFSRPVELESTEQGCRAVLRYEQLSIASDACSTEESALQALVDTLQARGYRQLKTQPSFRNGTYLGNHHPWTEYPDPREAQRPPTWLARLAGWFRAPVP